MDPVEKKLKKREYDRQRRINDRDHLRALRSRSHASNREAANARSRAYYATNRETIRARAKTVEGKAYRRQQAARRRSTPAGRIEDNMRRRIRDALQQQKTRKNNRTMVLVGCSKEQLVAHLAALFTDGMTMEALMDGRIHVDHIRPCSSFDLVDPDQQKACFHYTNLQPLWALDNLRKKAKWAAA